MEVSMRLIALPLAAIAVAALAGCDRPATDSSTTVVKEPAVVHEKETVREAPSAPSSSTTVVQPAPSAPSSSTTVVEPSQPSGSSTSVNIDASKPDTTSEKSRSTSTTRIDTPAGTATRTEKTDTRTSR
jgi:hypothetical protein